jgi:F-type H+-transporting ATPase subunit gamma
MAERHDKIVTQIQNIHQLHAVVTAMRGVAASRTQQSRALLTGVEAYAQVVSRAVGQAVSLLSAESSAPISAGSKGRGIILFCAEQGFAGTFSERVVGAAGDLAGTAIFLVGTRGVAVAGERGLNLAWSATMATQTGAVPGLANRIADALYAHIATALLSRVEIIFSQCVPGGGIVVTRRSLLPIDVSAFPTPVQRQPPLTGLSARVLLDRLVAEYVYAQLCEAAMQSFAAENEARMLAMTSARTNIEGKLGELTRRERQVRQEEITTEIIELAAGAEALMKLE